ncbi:MAG: hypothetical protein AAF355_10445 [Myxococcota bacterium]
MNHKQITAAAAATGASLLAQQVAGKSVRDAFFLSIFGSSELPGMMLGSALLSILLAFVLSKSFRRHGPTPILSGSLLLSSIFYAIEYWLCIHTPRITAIALYLHQSVIGAISVSAFFLLIGETLGLRDAKRCLPRIHTGVTFGAFFGGIAAIRIVAETDFSIMFLLLATTHALVGCVTFVPFLYRKPCSSAIEVNTTRHASNDIGSIKNRAFRDVYLRNIAMLVLVSSAAATLLDFAMKSSADMAFEGRSEDLIRFFVVYYTLTSLLTFGVQAGLGQIAVRRLGLGSTLSIGPIALCFTGVLALPFLSLGTITLLKATESILANSFFRSCYELLYAPLTVERKRSVKALIDIACVRAGDLAGSSLVLLILWWISIDPYFVPYVSVHSLTGLGSQLSIALALGLFGAALWLSRRIYRDYVAARFD